MKKTKVICTIGPASNNEQALEKLAKSGMDIARLNFSHGNAYEHMKNINLIKMVREKLGVHIAILLDTKGPEIRVGKFEENENTLLEGQIFTLKTEDIIGTKDACSITDKDLFKYVKPGDKILIDDGLIEMEVKKIKNTDIECEVCNPGILKDNKGINIPGVKTNLPAISDKDYDDIVFGIKNNIDFIAASFIRNADNVIELKKILTENGGKHIRIISKIENAEGVENIDEIIAVSDGIMVARGDLGVEIPIEQVPLIQKKIINKCNFAGKPVIIATQMLDSMIRNPRPTRAEVADVANAIFDGTDAVMLSGETASGKYPVEAIEMMQKIAIAAEAELDYKGLLQRRTEIRDTGITEAIGYTTCISAHGLRAAAILTPTSSGITPIAVAKFRPKAPIIATTTNEKVARQLTLSWGVYPIVISHHEDMVETIIESLEKATVSGYIKTNDLIIITAGVPIGMVGTTNMMRVHINGSAI